MVIPEDEGNSAAARVTGWELTASILASAIELAAEERDGFLRQACAGSQMLYEEVCVLLEAHESSGGFLETSLVRGGSAWNLEGRQIGPWLLGEKIGEGGMGVVYRGTRRYPDFELTAAVKICGVGLAPLQLRQRFRSELKILGSLHHPNITRLLDGGVSEDGVPYLAMELVEGQPIVEHCRNAGLSRGARMALMTKICQTVHYAHQRLVVHRDIKPSNVLVTGEGEPKLLDFGIARLLEPESDDRVTISACRAGSLRYSSPEHLRGAKVTTATDVYSLGVLLYELLTESPWPVPAAESLEDTVLAIEQAPAPRPSTIVPGVDADLDAIVAKATRPETQLRYASAEEMGADLERYARHWPVAARKGTAFYVARRFAARHRLAVACTGAALAAALAGGVAVSWESHVAQRERARAEARFNQVRHIANAFIEQSQTGLRQLPGSLEHRRQMTAIGLRYLDALTADPAADPGLSNELARGYLQLGQVLGSPNLPNLGDGEAARRSFEQALHLTRRVLDQVPGDPGAIPTFTSAVVHANDLAIAERRFSQVAELAGELERRLQDLPDQQDGRIVLVRAWSRIQRQIAFVETSGGEPLAEWRAAAAELEPTPVAAELPRRLAELFLLAGQPEKAEFYARRALQNWSSGEAARSGSVAVAGHHTSLARSLAGLALAGQGKLREGRSELVAAAQTLAGLAAAEPGDSQYKADLAETEMHLATVALRMDDRAAASMWFSRAAGRARTLAEPQGQPRIRFVLGRSLAELATLAGRGRPQTCELAYEAERWLRRNERDGVTLRSEKPWLSTALQLVRQCR